MQRVCCYGYPVSLITGHHVTCGMLVSDIRNWHFCLSKSLGQTFSEYYPKLSRKLV